MFCQISKKGINKTRKKNVSLICKNTFYYKGKLRKETSKKVKKGPTLKREPQHFGQYRILSIILNVRA
jgi:hypothetical protein